MSVSKGESSRWNTWQVCRVRGRIWSSSPSWWELQLWSFSSQKQIFLHPRQIFSCYSANKGQSCYSKDIYTFRGLYHLPFSGVFWYRCSVSAVSKEGWAALRSTGLGDRKPVPDPTPPSSTPWPPQSASPKSGRPLYDHARSPPGG